MTFTNNAESGRHMNSSKASSDEGDPARRGQPDAVEVELIRSLFDAFIPSAIMTVGFTVSGTLIVRQTDDRLLMALLAAGLLLSAVRLDAAMRGTRAVRAGALEIVRARQLERRFALPYTGFAVVLGLFGARAMTFDAPAIHMLMIALLVGYCAGVAAGIALRPRIALPSMIAALVPTATVALFRPDAMYLATGGLTLTMLAGGLHSVYQRYRRALRDTGLRLTLSALARRDGLTALPNRLALREWFDEHVLYAGANGPIAVHYLDIDALRNVNDGLGHHIGDALLTAVGARIAAGIRDCDIAARLNGDDFAIVQRAMEDPGEAEMLARRLVAALDHPFEIEGRRICITASVGYVVGRYGGHDLERLLTLAGNALYAGKRSGERVTGGKIDDDAGRNVGMMA